MAVRVQVGQEREQRLVEYLALVNKRLVEAGLPEHTEPTQLGEEKRFAASFSTDDGLKKLQVLTSWLVKGPALPEDGQIAVEGSLVYHYRYLLDLLGEEKDDIPPNPDLPYQHLIYHRVDMGCYVPIDFVHPVQEDFEDGSSVDQIGSVQRLQAECLDVARRIGMPVEAGAADAIDREMRVLQPGILRRLFGARRSTDIWTRYPDEAQDCLTMLRACEASLATGAMVVLSRCD